MNKKHRTIGKMISCAAIALVMVLGMALPALAAVYSSGTDSQNPAKAAITKVFKMPVNTPTPASTFVFKFDKVGMSLSTGIDTTKNDGMPNIADAIVSFLADEEPAGGTFISGDTKTLAKESADFVAGMTGSVWGNGEGVYNYIVYEDITSTITIVDPYKEWAAYSAAKYDVEIWVEKDADGILFAKYVCVKIVPNFVDEYYEGTDGGEKVDPTPGGVKQVPGDPTIDDDFSQVIFTNKYWKTDGGVTDPGSSALDIIKKIDGNGANLTAYFDFDVKVTQSSVIPTPQEYKAYIMLDGEIVTSALNYSGTIDTDGSILFESGTPKTISLTNNQKLVFVDLHIGSAVEAMEAASAEYIPSYIRTFSGTSEFTGVLNAAFGFPRTPGDEGPHYTIAGVNANTATFTNNRSGATPTGISVDNLPFIVLIVAAAAGLAGFVAIKARKSLKHGA